MVSRSIQVDDLLDIMLDRDLRIANAKEFTEAAVRAKVMRKWAGDMLIAILDGADVQEVVGEREELLV